MTKGNLAQNTNQFLETAAKKITQTELPIRKRLAEAYNYGLIHLTEYDFIEDDKKEKFQKISETLQAADHGKMETRADRSAEQLSLDQASELASEIIDLCRV